MVYDPFLCESCTETLLVVARAGQSSPPADCTVQQNILAEVLSHLGDCVPHARDIVR